MAIGSAVKNIFGGSADVGADIAKKVNKSAELAKKASDGIASSVKKLNSPELASDFVKNASKNINPAQLKAGLKKAAAEVGENTDAGKAYLRALDEVPINPKTAEALGGNLDQVKKIDDVGKTVLKKLDTAVDSATDFAKKNKKLLTGLAIAGTISGIAIAAEVRKNAINNAEYKIISIKPDPNDNKKTIITFDPSEVIREEDTIILSNTNSTPNVNGSPDFDIINMNSFSINASVTKEGNSGILKIRTTFSSQFSQIVKEAVDPALQVGSDITKSVANTFFDTIGDILGLPNLGEFFSNYWWLSLIVIILSSILSSMSIYYIQTSK